jgi:hypothetical protein
MAAIRAPAPKAAAPFSARPNHWRNVRFTRSWAGKPTVGKPPKPVLRCVPRARLRHRWRARGQEPELGWMCVTPWPPDETWTQADFSRRSGPLAPWPSDLVSWSNQFQKFSKIGKTGFEIDEIIGTSIRVVDRVAADFGGCPRPLDATNRQARLVPYPNATRGPFRQAVTIEDAPWSGGAHARRQSGTGGVLGPGNATVSQGACRRLDVLQACGIETTA